MSRPQIRRCSCGSFECNPFGCRFSTGSGNREAANVADSEGLKPNAPLPTFTDAWRFKKPYQPSGETDISRWLDEKLEADIKRHCGSECE